MPYTKCSECSFAVDHGDCDALCRQIALLNPDWAESGMAVESTELNYNGTESVTVRHRKVGDRWLLDAGGTKSGVRMDQAVEVVDGVAIGYAMGHLLERSLNNGPAWCDGATLGGLLFKYLPDAVIEPDYDLDGAHTGWIVHIDANHSETGSTKALAILRAVRQEIQMRGRT